MFYKKLVLAITFIGIVFIGASVAQAAYITPPSTVGGAVVLIDADTKRNFICKEPQISGCIQLITTKWSPC